MRGSNDGFVQLVLEGYIEGRKKRADLGEFWVMTIKNGPNLEQWE